MLINDEPQQLAMTLKVMVTCFMVSLRAGPESVSLKRKCPDGDASLLGRFAQIHWKTVNELPNL